MSINNIGGGNKVTGANQVTGSGIAGGIAGKAGMEAIQGIEKAAVAGASASNHLLGSIAEFALSNLP